MKLRIGIDLGGTKTEVAALDPSGKELMRRREPTPAGDYQATLRLILYLVESCEKLLQMQGSSVGLGIPGALSPRTGLVKNANSTWLIGRPLERDVTALLGRPVRIRNDADCFTLSEALDGAGMGRTLVFGAILGTGVGGGICLRGEPLSGPNAIAGEWGHNPLPWPGDHERPGPPCYCGKQGCIETFLSGPGLAADHARATGRDLDAEAIAAAALNGEPEALASMERYEDRLARALASVVNILDPDVIVLGGGLSNIRRLYGRLPGLMAAHVFSDSLHTPVVPAAHGDSSGVRGAAMLWDDL